MVITQWQASQTPINDHNTSDITRWKEDNTAIAEVNDLSSVRSQHREQAHGVRLALRLARLTNWIKHEELSKHCLPGVHIKQRVSTADVERWSCFYWNGRPHLIIIIIIFHIEDNHELWCILRKIVTNITVVTTSNLADDMPAILIIGFVLAMQDWLSMLGRVQADHNTRCHAWLYVDDTWQKGKLPGWQSLALEPWGRTSGHSCKPGLLEVRTSSPPRAPRWGWVRLALSLGKSTFSMMVLAEPPSCPMTSFPPAISLRTSTAAPPSPSEARRHLRIVSFLLQLCPTWGWQGQRTAPPCSPPCLGPSAAHQRSAEEHTPPGGSTHPHILMSSSGGCIWPDGPDKSIQGVFASAHECVYERSMCPTWWAGVCLPWWGQSGNPQVWQASISSLSRDASHSTQANSSLPTWKTRLSPFAPPHLHFPKRMISSACFNVEWWL